MSSLNREGKKNAAFGNSSVIGQILNDSSNNYRIKLEKKGIKPKNYQKANLESIKKIQNNFKNKKLELEETNKSKKQKFILPKF